MQFDSWYKAYNSRISDWVAECGAASKDVILLLPDLIQLAEKIVQTDAIREPARGTLQKQVQTITDGIEYLPDSFVATIGLVDDAVRLAVALQNSGVEIATMQQYWTGEGDIDEHLHYLLHNRDDFAPRC